MPLLPHAATSTWLTTSLTCRVSTGGVSALFSCCGPAAATPLPRRRSWRVPHAAAPLQPPLLPLPVPSRCPAAYPRTDARPAVVPFNSELDASASGYMGSMSRNLRTWLALQAGPASALCRCAATPGCDVVHAEHVHKRSRVAIALCAELHQLSVAQRQLEPRRRQCQR